MAAPLAFAGMEHSPRSACRTAVRVATELGSVEVPVFDVEKQFYIDATDDVPEKLHYSRVYAYESDPRLRADEWLPDGSVVVMREVDYCAGEFVAERFTDPPSPGGKEVELWRSPVKSESEFEMLVRRLSASEALDYWAVKIAGIPVSRWTTNRNVSSQTVDDNVQNAVRKLQS